MFSIGEESYDGYYMSLKLVKKDIDKLISTGSSKEGFQQFSDNEELGEDESNNSKEEELPIERKAIHPKDKLSSLVVTKSIYSPSLVTLVASLPADLKSTA